MSDSFFQFNEVIYPLWRRKFPFPLNAMLKPILNQVFPAYADYRTPPTPKAMAQYLSRWNILGGTDSPFVDASTLARGIEGALPNFQHVQQKPAPPAPNRTVNIPAQWEPMEKILLSWAVVYPALWDMHAQMTEAISPVSTVEILVPDEMWARAVWMYLTWRGKVQIENVRFLVLPTNDIWIRDYGPIIGLDKKGEQIVLNTVYDPLVAYPQETDNAMNSHWAGHHEISMYDLNVHTEGGNLWSDGLGTLVMTEQIFYSNPYFDRDSLEASLHTIVDYEKLIITPRLPLEETGHVDMLVKLASPDTVLVSSPKNVDWLAANALRHTIRQFGRETNANGQPYHVVELPTPPMYLNWFLWSIRRSYTNSLTVNGRVLVPIYGLDSDDEALQIYAETMPDYEIIPIDSRVGINGGGAVHCMTKEVPGAPRK